MKEITITKIDDGQRAEKFVRKYLPDAPLGFIYKAFRKKDIKANGHWIHKDYVLQEGDVIRIYVTDQQLEDFRKPKEREKKDLEFPIAYEDANVIVVDKPAGLLVYGDASEKRNTLTNKVLDYLYLKGEYDPKAGAFTPAPAHRIDRNTSGLVVFGKNDSSLKVLEELFKDRNNIEKTYLALVAGHLSGEGEVNAPLLKDANTGMVRVGKAEEGAKNALTKYKVIKQYEDSTLVECVLITGRTHQIRVHMASIGHPLIGDAKYGDFNLNKSYKRRYGYEKQFLHANAMEFKEPYGVLAPLAHKKIVAPLPKDKQSLLDQLGK